MDTKSGRMMLRSRISEVCPATRLATDGMKTKAGAFGSCKWCQCLQRTHLVILVVSLVVSVGGAYICYPFGACIDLWLEAELSVVMLGSGLSAGILLLLVQSGQSLHLVQEALPSMGLFRGRQHMRCTACLWTEGALLVLL